MKKLLSTAVLLLALTNFASAQTSPNFTYGQVPTVAQWNALFAAKADYLGAPPLLLTGGTMTGPLGTAASITGNAGLNLAPGIAPTSPNNGDVWTTALGLYVQINGTTVGPLTSAATPCTNCALTTNPLSQFASTTSAQLRGVLSDETGTGSAVFATSPTLVTPTLGAAIGTSLALGGASIGSNALAITGTSNFAGTATFTTQLTLPDSSTWTSAGIANLLSASIVAGTLAPTSTAFSITGTMPASPTGFYVANNVTMTGAGTANQATAAMEVTYAAGYTGSNSTNAFEAVNLNAGTGATLIPAAGSNTVTGNVASVAATTATTTGANVGSRGSAGSGSVNVGVLGLAQTITNSATNIGVVGSAINTGTSPVEIGGWFSLNQTSVPGVSAALIADNGGTTNPIALFRVNGTTQISIAVDGGLVAGSATGGSKGAGTLNLSSGIFVNGVALAGTGTMTTLTAGTAISLSSGATCNVTCTINNTGVTSIATQTGALTIAASNPLTNSGTVLSVTQAAKSDQQAGTSNAVSVTPLHQQDHASAAKAWVNFTGSGTNGAQTVNASYNVTGVSRTALGNYTVTFTTAFATAFYSCHVAGYFSAANVFGEMQGSAPAVGSVTIAFTNSSTFVDPTQGHIVCFGGQ